MPSATAMTFTSPTAFPSDPLPFFSFDHGFPPLDFLDNFFVSNYESSPNSNSRSGPDDPSQDHDSPNSNSTVSTEPLSLTAAVVDERKRRRMLSNRESARRSRMRKQKHLENVRDQVSRLRLQNREISNRLTQFLCHGRRLVFENNQLHHDNLNLRQKLSEVRKVILLGQLPQHQDLIALMDWTCNNDDMIRSIIRH